MSKILVTGSNGQLGSEIKLLTQENKNFFFTDKSLLDIKDSNKIKQFCINNQITHIINCAAYTAVDKAESEKELVNQINHIAVKNLAEISKELNIILIHISTDYVFDGKNYIPYKENNKTNPQGVYGKTKLDGEIAFQKSGAKGIIIRTSWVYSEYGNNFVKTMLKLSKSKDKLCVVFDQVGTPTYAKDLAKTILKILKTKKLNYLYAEIYHYSNEGVCSWYDFAKEIFELSNIDIEVNPIETKDYPMPAKRPKYSVLNKAKIKNDFDINIPYWKDSLEEMLKDFNE